MVVVPRASTHLEYTDISYVLPASRYGQALTSVYIAGVARPLPQARRRRPCWPRRSTTSSRPRSASGTTIKLDRASLLSFYYCSGYDYRKPGAKKARAVSNDFGGVGGC